MRSPPLVLPVTPGLAGLGGSSGLIRVIAELASAGAHGVLIREPELSDQALYEVATAARELFGSGWVGVHDRVHVAIASEADAVHLGYKSFSPLLARTITSGGLRIGHSQHSSEIADVEMEADYRFIGPIYETPSKAGLVDPIGPEALRGLPMADRTWAVGGIGPEGARAALDTGVRGVACIGSVFGHGEIRAGVSAMLEAVRDDE